MDRDIFTEEHLRYRETVRRFVQREVVPHRDRWERAGRVDRSLFTAAGALGILGHAAPEEHDGAGVDEYRYNAILSEDLAAADVVTNGLNADLVITAVKTDPAAGHRGISLLVVEDGMPGFAREPKLAKIGQHAQDTAELFFTDVRVPAGNRLGEQGSGFSTLMRNLAQERLGVAVGAVAQARRAFELSLAHARQRHAFGAPTGSFQHNRFVLAELKTEIDIAQTDVDAHISTIYAGSTEVMKEIVGRSLGL